MNLFSLSGLILGGTCVFLLFILLKFGKAKIHKIWSLFNLSVAVWGFGAFLIGRATSESSALFFWRIAHIGSLCIAIFFYHTVCLFCSIKRRNLLNFAYAQLLLFELINLFDFFRPDSFLISNSLFSFHSLYYIKANMILYKIMFSIWLSYVILGHYELIKFFRKASNIQRNQTLYLFCGFFVGFIGGMTNFLPMFNINVYPFGNFTIPLYCIIVTYAILKYRLTDINVAFTRAGIFVAVYSFVLGIPFVIANTYRPYLKTFLGENWLIVPLLTLTFLATVGPFVYLYINRKAEAALLKEQKSYQNILRNASSGMIRIKNLDKLLNVIAHVVAKAVKIKHSSIFLLDKESSKYVLRAERGIKNEILGNSIIDFGSPLVWTLVKNKEPIIAEEAVLKLNEDPQNLALTSLVKQLSVLKANLVIPSFIENKLIGILVLGEKRSKKLYSQDDLVVFSVLANQAALAIENAQFYDEIKQTHEQLFQAEKLATIGTMADGLSHQINNRFHALSLIAGDSLDMLKTFDIALCNDQTRQVLADLRGALERIESNVLQGGEVVKGLLKYSRPGDTGHEAVDFKDVVNGAIDMVQYKIKLNEIDLVQDIPQDIPKIHANLIQLQEVFFNLIDNAYDAIKERQLGLKEDGYKGKIQIQVRSSDGILAVVVSDNGMGIKDLDRKKLFTPFFTTKATAKKGTGLGLYVIEKIISSHNGKIIIDSTYLSGTQFNISLPIFKPAAK